MRFLSVRVLSTAILALIAGKAFADCDQPRREVRFAIDRPADKIEVAPVNATIEDLHKQFTRRETKAAEARVEPTEVTVYRVDGLLAHFEGDYQPIDSDAFYVLTIATADGKRAMQVEVPSPRCAAASPLYDSMVKARRQFDTQFPNKPSERQSPRYDIPVRVTGVGYLETSNGWRTLRLAPVLDLQFNPADFGQLEVTSAPAADTASTAVAMTSAEPDPNEPGIPQPPKRRSRLLPFLGIAALVGAIAFAVVKWS
jgi:hypothetical protein